MAPTYTYVAADLLTDNILNEVPLGGVSFDRELNKAGQLRGTTSLDNEWLSNEDMISATEPGRTSLYVYRENQIVWGGIIWARWYQSQAKVLQIYCETFESFAFANVYRPSSVRRFNENQTSIILKLWQTLQSSSGSGGSANIGVLDAELPSVDVSRQLVVNPWDFKTYGDLIEELLDHDDACDYTIEVSESSGQPIKQLRLGYPRLGNILDHSNLVLTYPGNILNYYWTESASEGAVRWYATGDGDRSSMRVGTATDSDKLDSGYPLIEKAHLRHPGITKQADIDAHAAFHLLQQPLPFVTKQFEIKGDVEPEFGTYGIGDDARVEIQDARFPAGINSSARAIGWKVTPPSGESTEEIQMVVEGVF